ncbi:MAG: GNAT family N-acetyltransferase [Candidatus Latescibacteria bacterium]|nr:GNAT family N-acetyltransferase [Candidatus Latescibacterota bacterium]
MFLSSMPTSIRPYEPSDLKALHELYESLVSGRVPHCWPVSEAQLADVLAAPAHLKRNKHVLLEQAVLVAAPAGGFIHVGLHGRDDGEADLGIIRFLGYPRSDRALGDALLAAGQQWLRDRGAESVCGGSPTWRYAFHGFPNCYLSDRLDHVQALLQFRGYQKTGGEVFLDWPDMNPVVAPAPAGMTFEPVVEEEPGAGILPGIRVQARDGDQILGTCVLKSGGETSQHDEAEAFAFCEWLGVQEPWQGKGLGRYLLAHALGAARERGYRHGAISTAFDNHRAFVFYSHHGFRVVDWTYEFRLELNARTPPNDPA